jgi:small subunit ribosomal protein S8
MDRTANLLTSLRNAEMARHETVMVPDAKFNRAILHILQEAGYIRGFGEPLDGQIAVTLVPRQLHTYKRISKSGRRVYANVGNLPHVLQGLGLAIISTSKGLLSDKEARKQGVGGEVVCTVF